MRQVIQIAAIASLLSLVYAQNGCFFSGCRCVKNIDDSHDVICVSQNNETFPLRAKSNITELINTFLIKQYNFQEIPDGTFDNLRIRNLIIGENNLHKLTKSTFRGIKHLALLKVIEKNFEIIEPGALDHINELLTELGIWQINYKGGQIDSFFNEINQLKNLKTLTLMGYGLEKFKPEWTKVFSNITYLSLASNDLKTIDPEIFKSVKRLESIDLSNNFISDLSSVFVALQPVRNTIREIKVAANYLKQIPDFSDLPNLQILDLSNNKIEIINETTFKGLKRLNTLLLSSNSIQIILDGSLDSLAELNTLLLDNNYLKSVPVIKTLKNLRLLDMSNQNGKLSELKDYSFDRNGSISSLSLNLDMNDIVKFGNRVFCSRQSNVSEIRKVDLSYNTTSNLNKCLLRQIKSKISDKVELNVVIKSQQLEKKNTICDCKLKNYVQSLRIDLVGPCADLAGVCTDEKTNLDECNAKKEFECGV